MPLSNYEIKFIYIELGFLFLGMKMLMINTVGLSGMYGLDVYYEISAINDLMDSGHWLASGLTSNSVDGYPTVHFLGSIISQISNIKIVYLTNVLSILTNLFSLVLLYCIGKKLFDDEKIILTTILGFIFVFLFIFSTFDRTLISYPLFLLIIYSFLVSHQKIIYNAISILAMLILVYSHPIAPIVLLIFILSLYVTNYLFNSKKIFHRFFKNLNSNLLHVNSNFMIMLVVIILAYFVYISLWQQRAFVNIIDILCGVETVQRIGTTSEVSFKWRIFLLGNGLVLLIYGLVFLKFRNYVKNAYAPFFMFFAMVLGFFSFTTYLLKLEFIRYLLFIWPFVLFATSYTLMKAKKQELLSILVILMIFVNIAGYYPETYEISENQTLTNRLHLTEQETIAIKTTNPSGRIVSNHYIQMAVLAYTNASSFSYTDFYLKDYKDPTKYRPNYFYFEKDDMENLYLRGFKPVKVPYETYIDYKKTKHMNEIYDNGQVEGYTIIPI